MPVLPDTLPELAPLARALLGLDPWTGPDRWDPGVPTHVPAGALVARAWLARRVRLADDARFVAAAVMHVDGWVLYERPDAWHFFSPDALPYPWATRVPGLPLADAPAALALACLAAPWVDDGPTAPNRPPLDW